MNKKWKHLRSDLLKESNLTYNDYASLNDGHRYELVSTQLKLMSPSPTVTHQIMSFQMQRGISKSCETDYLILNAPVDVILSDNEIRQPDLGLVNRKKVAH